MRIASIFLLTFLSCSFHGFVRNVIFIPRPKDLFVVCRLTERSNVYNVSKQLGLVVQRDFGYSNISRTCTNSMYEIKLVSTSIYRLVCYILSLSRSLSLSHTLDVLYREIHLVAVPCPRHSAFIFIDLSTLLLTVN